MMADICTSREDTHGKKVTQPLLVECFGRYGRSRWLARGRSIRTGHGRKTMPDARSDMVERGVASVQRPVATLPKVAMTRILGDPVNVAAGGAARCSRLRPPTRCRRRAGGGEPSLWARVGLSALRGLPYICSCCCANKHILTETLLTSDMVQSDRNTQAPKDLQNYRPVRDDGDSFGEAALRRQSPKRFVLYRSDHTVPYQSLPRVVCVVVLRRTTEKCLMKPSLFSVTKSEAWS